MRVKAPDSKVIDFPDTMSQDQVTAAMGKLYPKQEAGIGTRIGEDWKKRNQELADIALSNAKGQPLPITGLRTAANVAVRGIDTAGEVAKSIWHSDPNEPIQAGITKGIQTVAQSAPVQATATAYSDWKQKHPDAAAALESTVELGSLFPAGKAIKIGAEVASAPVLKAAKEGVENVAAKALPPVSEGLIPSVKLAQKYKIPMSMDEVTGSRALKSIQKTGQDLPFSGQQAFREKQMEAFNQGVLSTVGEKGNKITPEVMNKAFKRLGGEFDKLGANKMFNLKGQFENRVNEIRAEAGQTMSKDAIENYNNTVKALMKDVDKNGYISGEKLNKARAKVNALMRKTNNYDTKQLLGDLENNIIDMMTAEPEAAKNFAKTKQQYKNLIVLEPLVAKGKAGNISPLKLSDRVARVYGRAYTTGQAGDIGELARVGRDLLPELGGSDTATRMAYGLGSAYGALQHPLITGTVLGGNRGFQELINRNQDLIGKAMQKATQ